jgi:DME family drug/metabolite transporter
MTASCLYTAASICQRQLVACDALWAACVKAVPTMLLAAGGMWWLRRRGRPWPAPRVFAALLLTGLLVQLAGNGAFQWSLAVVGLAPAVPLCFGALIVGGALLGRLYLGEPITVRAGLAMILLLAAIGLLAAGSKHTAAITSPPPAISPGLWSALGVAAALGSGLAYAVQGAVIRHVARREVPVMYVLLVLSTTGVASLGTISILRLGADGIVGVSQGLWAWLALQGLFNAGAFYALSKSLQWVPMVQVNVLNASQIALAALAGVIFFHEEVTAYLLGGVGLTIVGLLLIDRGSPARTASGARPR